MVGQRGAAVLRRKLAQDLEWFIEEDEWHAGRGMDVSGGGCWSAPQKRGAL
jgi:hypothetical protein